jgi:hypothetical protein
MEGIRSGFADRGFGQTGVASRIACVVLAFAPAAAAGQSVVWGIRAGVVASTPLAEDRVANPELAAALGGGLGPVRAVPAPAFHFEVGGAVPMRPRTVLELAMGWTMAGIDAKDDAGTRPLQDVGVGHATVSVHYLATRRLDGGCGIGLIRYFAESRALFASGTEVSPLLECAGRAGIIGDAGRRLVLRIAGQMHRFRTPVLADAGARSGTVFRLAVQAGVELGGTRR